MLVGLGILGVLRLGRNGSRRRLVAGSTVVLAAVVIVAAPVSSRVSLGDRPAYWGVAIEDASDHVVLGSGAGTFDDYWREHRPIAAYVRDAHSLYLETAAELGIVGLALLLCALGAPLVAGAMSRGRPLVSIAAAAYVTFLVHAGLDWDWEMPVTTLAGLALAAALLVSPRADV
jgi:O-antigen ligase